MNITENYIGYDALVSYLIEVSYSIESIESNNYIYYEFLSPNQDIIISSLNSLTNSSKALDLNEWQNFNFTWYNRFLKAAKNLFEPDIFIAVKKKIQEEHFCSKEKLQIFWQKIIKEFNKKKNFPKTSQSDLKVIKECDKKNLILAETLQPDVLTENYIGYNALVSYLIEVSYSIESIESNNYIYYKFLSPNQDIIISSLNSLTNSSKALDLNEWQNFNFTWYNRFLKAAKNLFEPDIFIAVKKKIQEEHFCSKEKLQIFWQKIIKEFNKKKNFPETSQSDLSKKMQEVIKECDKKNLILAETSQPDILTENYIGYNALISYLIEVSYSIKSKNYIYYKILNSNQDIIISLLNSLTNSSKALDLNNWQNFNFTWYNRFLKAAKNLFEPDIFIVVKEKIQEEYFYFYSKEKLQIFWQKIIKEFNKKKNFPETSQSDLEVIKECDKKNLILAEIFQPDTLLSKKTSKDFIKNLSETLQPDLQVIKEYKKENLVFTETSQPDVLQPDVLLSKKTVKIPIENHFEFTDFCYDILHELENKSYAKSYANKSYKHINLKLKNNQYTSLEEFEKDIRLIFCNCYIYNNVESEVISLEELKREMMIQQIRELKREIRNQILEQNKNNFNRCFP
ncbi:unnamed protein product [Rhizophagus irregularis]|uniref:Bromo domain-containing protein n=2 Tax=Rhizophagus irregularis TaxID=588596 RepID=A0A916E6U2_9GLOM|nr:unnamed protein product [Rhizophagus irregularis]